MKILVINGPNLNFLGIREKAIYGNEDYDFLVNMLEEEAKNRNKEAATDADKIELEVWQSNHEGAIIDKLQEAYFNGTAGIVINPGAYTHYSYAIHDALKSLENIIKVEVHISDIKNREDFRANSVTAPACDKQIYGHGLKGYVEAIQYIIKGLEKN